MSSLFFRAEIESSRLDSVADALSFVPEAWRWSHTAGKGGIVVTRVDDRALWSPIYDPGTGIVVAIGGRLAFDAIEWARINQPDDALGTVAREVLRLYQADGPQALATLNGAFGILVGD